MNAFISYAIHANEQYILNLLAQKIAETGLTLVTSYNQSDYIDAQVANDIRNSAVFIGLITKSGRPAKISRVYSEFKQANLFSKPAILLIEEGVVVAPWVSAYQNTIWFNPYSIHKAAEIVNNKIYHSKPSDAGTWIVGGAIVLALLALLSNDKK
jgi:hypothetical protein